MILRSIVCLGLAALALPHASNLGLGQSGALMSTVSNGAAAACREMTIVDQLCGAPDAQSTAAAPIDMAALRTTIFAQLRMVKGEILADQQRRAAAYATASGHARRMAAN